MNTSDGHREKLRTRFTADPHAFTEVEILELLLTYAIPRRDVAPLARDLIARFGSLQAVITAPTEQLMEIDGVGESTAAFVQLIQSILVDAHETQTEMSPTKQSTLTPQLNLFELEPEVQKIPAAHATIKQPVVKERPMRVFANDEVANSLNFLPQAANYKSLEEFQSFLCEKLPYNAAETRRRRARNILERFYPEGHINTPLSYFTAQCSSKADLQPVVFYHVLKAEPIAAKIAEELIWPALPIGRVERDQVNEFILRYLPDVKPASLEKILESLSHTYSLTDIGALDKKGIRFQLRQGSLESFLYLLTSEFQEPGIYSFDNLYSSPLHRWLLWDREWLRMQLYNLQDFGILSKVSEIDTVRQFTLVVDQWTALHQYFEHPDRSRLAIRETADELNSTQED